MVQFKTQEWANAFMDSLNKNPNYKESAKTWEGELLLIFKAEKIHLQDDVTLWLDLWHGECRAAKFMGKDENLPFKYTITAKESVWNDLITDQLDASKALMSGKFKISGNAALLMRYPKAAAYIIKYLKRLLTSWD